MINILITIVFLAEILLALIIIAYLSKFDKIIINANELVCEVKPDIQDIAKLLKGLSEQFLEFAPIIDEKLKEIKMNILFGIMEHFISSLLFFKVRKKFKIIKRGLKR